MSVTFIQRTALCTVLLTRTTGVGVNRFLESDPLSTSHSSDPGELSFITNYALVLSLVGRSPDLRVRDLSLQTGLTERGIQRIIDVLSANGYLHISKHGKRNHYEIQMEMPVFDLRGADKTVGDLVRFISD